MRKLYEEMYKGEKLLKVQKEIPEVADASGKHGWTVGGFQVHSSGKRAVVVVSPFKNPHDTFGPIDQCS